MPRVSLKSHQKGTHSFCEDNVLLIKRDELVKNSNKHVMYSCVSPKEKMDVQSAMDMNGFLTALLWIVFERRFLRIVKLLGVAW